MQESQKQKPYFVLKTVASLASIFLVTVCVLIIVMIGVAPLFPPQLTIRILFTYPTTAVVVPITSIALHYLGYEKLGRNVWWVVVAHFILIILIGIISAAIHE